MRMSTMTDRRSGINSSVAFKAPVRVATTAAISLSGFQVIDGVTLADGDTNLRVLVKDQANSWQNGIYDCKSGSWTRAVDFDGNTDWVNGTQVYVQFGNTNVARWYVSCTEPVVVDTTAVTWNRVIDTTPVVDNLSSTSTSSALSAKQGKVLNDALSAKLDAANVDNTLTSTSTSHALAAAQGKVLNEQQGINTQTASYQLVLTDAGKIIEMNVGTGNTLTIPPNSTAAFATGVRIDIVQIGAGQTTIAAGAGVTIRSGGSKLKITGQYSAASLYKRGTDEWVLAGDITT
jgi:hypothetical protein